MPVAPYGTERYREWNAERMREVRADPAYLELERLYRRDVWVQLRKTQLQRRRRAADAGEEF